MTTPKLQMKTDFHYVWVAGSCDYGHKERCSGGAYTMIKDNEVSEIYAFHDDHTTEFRMILTAMIHAMKAIPEGSDIVFLTNVSYILHNWDKEPTEKSANADLIKDCISVKERHTSVSVRLVPFHKYHQLQETSQLAHEEMDRLRCKKNKSRINLWNMLKIPRDYRIQIMHTTFAHRKIKHHKTSTTNGTPIHGVPIHADSPATRNHIV